MGVEPKNCTMYGFSAQVPIKMPHKSQAKVDSPNFTISKLFKNKSSMCMNLLL